MENPQVSSLEIPPPAIAIFRPIGLVTPIGICWLAVILVIIGGISMGEWVDICPLFIAVEDVIIAGISVGEWVGICPLSMAIEGMVISRSIEWIESISAMWVEFWGLGEFEASRRGSSSLCIS